MICCYDWWPREKADDALHDPIGKKSLFDQRHHWQYFRFLEIIVVHYRDGN